MDTSRTLVLVVSCSERNNLMFASKVTTEDMAALWWVKPKIVVEVSSVEWTGDGCCGIPSSSACEKTTHRARSDARNAEELADPL